MNINLTEPMSSFISESIHRLQSVVDNEDTKLEILDTAGQVSVISQFLQELVVGDLTDAYI